MRQLAISWATEFLPRFVIGGAEKGDCGRCGAEIPRLGVDSMGGCARVSGGAGCTVETVEGDHRLRVADSLYLGEFIENRIA